MCCEMNLRRNCTNASFPIEQLPHLPLFNFLNHVNLLLSAETVYGIIVLLGTVLVPPMRLMSARSFAISPPQIPVDVDRILIMSEYGLSSAELIFLYIINA